MSRDYQESSRWFGWVSCGGSVGVADLGIRERYAVIGWLRSSWWVSCVIESLCGLVFICGAFTEGLSCVYGEL